MKWVQLCSSFNIRWHCLSLELEWTLIFSSPSATAEFSKFAGITGLCNFLGSVLSQQKFEEMVVKAFRQNMSQFSDRPCYSSQVSDSVIALGQISVIALFYLENKLKYVFEAWGHADPKDAKKKREHARTHGRENIGLLIPVSMFFSPHPGSTLHKMGLARSAFCSTSGPHLGPQTFLCSTFASFSLPCLLATTILDSFFLILTT